MEVIFFRLVSKDIQPVGKKWQAKIGGWAMLDKPSTDIIKVYLGLTGPKVETRDEARVYLTKLEKYL